MKAKSCRILSIFIIFALILTGLLPSLEAWAAQTLRVARIMDLEGEVQVMKAGGEKAFKAFKGMSLTKGDKIITGPRSWAMLEVGNNSEMKLAENTQLAITELSQSLEGNGENTSLSLWAGAAYTNVKSKLSSDSRYEIKTPTAVMGVRGTKFVTSHRNGMTIVTALSGEVTVTITRTITEPDGTERVEQVEVVLEKNQQFARSEGAAEIADFDLDTLNIEELDLFTLEVIQEVNQLEPGLIDPELLEGLEELIEQRREELASRPPAPPAPQGPQIIYEGDSGGDEGGGEVTLTAVEIGEIANISMAPGEMVSLNIVTTPQADTINATAEPEGLVGFSVMGNTLNISSGYTEGTATVTVTARKAGYTDGTRTFSVTVTEQEQVAAPTAEPDPEAIYSETINVTLSTETEGALIWYTVDGSDPRESTGERMLYQGGFTLDETTTVKAYATKEGMRDSDVAVFEYEFEEVAPQADMENPKVVWNGENFLLVYEKEVAPGKYDICGKMISETGEAGQEFLISTGTENNHSPAIASDSEGNCLVVWAVYGGGSPFAMYGQFISADGVLNGENFVIDGNAAYKKDYPTLAYDSINSKYLVAWEEYENSPKWREIYGRLVDVSDPETVSVSPRVNLVNRDLAQYDPQLSYLSESGKYLLVYREVDKVAGLLINPDGSKTNDWFVIADKNEDERHYPEGPFVCADEENNCFLVVWYVSNTVQDEYLIEGRFVSGNGTLLGNSFIISESHDPYAHQMNPVVIPAVTADEQARYLVAWEDYRGENVSLAVAALSAEGEVLGEPHMVGHPVIKYYLPVLAYDPLNSRYLLAYGEYQNEDESYSIGYTIGNNPGAGGAGGYAGIQAQALAAGATHSLVILDGEVWSTGDNGADYTLGLAPVGLSGVAAVSANKYYSLALKNDGTVWAWGKNNCGQLGNGTNYLDSAEPAQVAGLSDIVAVSAGESHALALKADGTVWAWGDNNLNKLGIGSEVMKTHTPQKVQSGEGSGDFTGVVAIGAGFDHSLALKEDGSVWAWGDNGSKQLGQGTTGNEEEAYPIQVKDNEGTGYLTGITAIAAGPMHNLALKEDGTVWSWGWNYYGQLGIGNKTNRGLPEQVVINTDNQPLTGITKIAAGGNWAGHSLALDSSGKAYAWGNGDYGQLGFGGWVEKRTIALEVPGLSAVTEIAAGGEFGTSLFLEEDGTVKACGFNDCGELGDGTEQEQYSVVTMVQASITPDPADITMTNLVTHPDFWTTDEVRVDNVPPNTTVKVYSMPREGTLLGSETMEAGSEVQYVNISIEGGFPQDNNFVWVTFTEEGKAESRRISKEIPKPPLMSKNADFFVDNAEYGYEKVTFVLTPEQIAAMETATGKTIAKIRGFVAREEYTEILSLPGLSDSTVDYVEIDPADLEDSIGSIAKEPGNYYYAVAVYDASENVIAYFLSDTMITVYAAS